MASPNNQQLLRALLPTAGITAEPLDSPQKLALAYYLRSPFRPEELANLHLRLRSAQPAAFEARGVAEANSPTDTPEPTPLSHAQSQSRPVPGDLAAIARFPRNKISRLPAQTREAINRMLRQCLPYGQILKELGEAVKHLNKDNLSRWKKTGYLIWLHEQEKREEAQAQLQFLLDLVREKDNGTIHEAAQQLGALKTCYLLADLDVTALKQSLQQDAAAFLRLLQALPRLSQAGMNCEHLRLALEERKIQLGKDKIPQSKRIPTREELMEIMRQVKIM